MPLSNIAPALREKAFFALHGVFPLTCDEIFGRPRSVNKEAAAVLLAEDSLTNAQIIKKVGTSASTMDRWRKVPEFQTRIDENITAFRARVIECGLPREKSRPAATDKSGTSSEMKSVGRGSSGLVMENPSNWVWSKEKEAAAELLALLGCAVRSEQLNESK